MNRILLSLILGFGSLSIMPFQANAEINTQKSAIEILLLVRNISISAIDDICNPNICLNEHDNEQGLSEKLMSEEEKVQNDYSVLLRSKKSSQKTQKAETYAVSITVINGFTFHVADYYGDWGNSRVVTALDGELRGRQEIADNGIIMAASTNVIWHKDFFEHTYPAGKVYTYQNKQVLKIKLQ